MPCRNKKIATTKALTADTSIKPNLIKPEVFCKIIIVSQEKQEKIVRNRETSNSSIFGKKSFDFSHKNIFLLGVIFSKL